MEPAVNLAFNGAGSLAMESPPMLRVAEPEPVAVEEVRNSWSVAEEPPLPLPLAEPEPEPEPVSVWESSPVIPEPPPVPATTPEPVAPSIPAVPAAEAKPTPTNSRAAEATEKVRCTKCGSRDTWRFGRVKGLRLAIANMAGGQWVTCRGCGGRFLTRQFGPMEEDDD